MVRTGQKRRHRQRKSVVVGNYRTGQVSTHTREQAYRWAPGALRDPQFRVKVQYPLYVSSVEVPAYMLYDQNKGRMGFINIGKDPDFDKVMKEELEEVPMGKVYFDAYEADGLVTLTNIARLPEGDMF